MFRGADAHGLTGETLMASTKPRICVYIRVLRSNISNMQYSLFICMYTCVCIYIYTIVYHMKSTILCIYIYIYTYFFYMILNLSHSQFQDSSAVVSGVIQHPSTHFVGFTVSLTLATLGKMIPLACKQG